MVAGMWVSPGALTPVPSHATIDEATVAAVIKDLLRGDALRHELDATFRRLELRHSALAELIAGEVAEIDSAAGQALGYFLFLTVYVSFEQRFGPRLGPIAHRQLDAALQRLLTDSEVRERCAPLTCSEDVLAIGQPALMQLIDREIRKAPDSDALVPMFEVLLVELLVLSEAVAPR
jgi:hypothetical protein